MKWIVALLMAVQMLSAAMPFTLENLNGLRLFLINQSDFIKPSDEIALKRHIKNRLKKEGFLLDVRDPKTFFVKIESIQSGKLTFINTQIGVGEEVVTHRHDDVETFAFTYHYNDFIETETPREDLNVSIDFMMDEFLEHYRDDN